MNDPVEQWMQQAIDLAKKAADHDEVPVGAVVVLDGKVIGQGYNQPISSNDPTAHAEIVAIRDACQTMGNYRLPGAILVVTLEPCQMCMGAIIHTRIKELVFGASDPKPGIHNHDVSVRGGVMAKSASTLLTDFFKARR